MGKKQHQSDKLYLTANEWKHFYGGKKTDTQSLKDAKDFKRLPFYSCSLTFLPCKHPYVTPQGHVFDLENIVPFLTKHGRNPISGEPLDGKSLVKVVFHKNAKEQYHCPITFKVFNENSYIVCIAKTGNVFSFDAVDELNLKPNFLRDLLSDEPFVKKDIITIQDPNNLSKFNINDFFYLKENLKWEKDDSADRQNPNYYLKALNETAKSTIEQLNATYTAPTTSTSSSNFAMANSDSKADLVNKASFSTGRVAASFTSTVMEICTRQEPAIIDENTIRWSRLLKSGKKGYACLVTNFGRLNVELFCDQVPRVCENFLKLCANKYYKDTLFHRSIRNFMIQGGDPTGTGTGGQSIWEKPFDDEFKPNLSHNGRGILSMANSGPNTNKSQFFITYRSCPHLDNVHSIFGKIVGGLDVLTKMEAVETDKKDRPKVSIKIEDCIVFVDPYKEIDEQILSERTKSEKQSQPVEPKEKPTKELFKQHRTGVGKYISSTVLEKKHKLSTQDDEEKAELKYKKQKSSSTLDKSDFSAW